MPSGKSMNKIKKDAYEKKMLRKEASDARTAMAEAETRARIAEEEMKQLRDEFAGASADKLREKKLLVKIGVLEGKTIQIQKEADKYRVDYESTAEELVHLGKRADADIEAQRKQIKLLKEQVEVLNTRRKGGEIKKMLCALCTCEVDMMNSNSGAPLCDGRVCGKCNATRIIPYRIYVSAMDGMGHNPLME